MAKISSGSSQHGSLHTASATACISTFTRLEKQELQNFRQTALERINGLELNVRDLDPDAMIGQCKILVRPSNDDEVGHLVAHTGRHWLTEFIAIDLITSDFDLDSLAGSIQSSDDREISHEERLDLARYGFSDEAGRFLTAIISLWNICYYGCLTAIHTLEKFDDVIINVEDGPRSRVFSAFDIFSGIEGKFNAEMQPATALGWSQRCQGYWTGYAQTRVQRAVACLSRITSEKHDNSTYNALLWALAGLEALYCDNESSISYQIRRRAPLLLEKFEIANLDKQISKGYNFRSRLFHGNVKISSPFADEINDDDDQDHHDLQADRYSDFFCLLLNCSILRCMRWMLRILFFQRAVSLSQIFDPIS